MKLGYIHNNRAEQARVMQVLKLTSESVALDELGIGRLRDAFADKMFPGISTLQKHVKYFSLLPQLYRKATERRYNRLSEVRDEIVRLERLMTKNLCEGSPEETGITGSETIGKSMLNYVKYDPAYIYNSGLQTFGILRTAHLYEQIYSASRAQHDAVKPYTTEDENTANDADESVGLYQFCAFPAVDYDFTRACSLALTAADRDFITSHILQAEACRGTLLRHLVENDGLLLANKFEEINPDTLPPDLSTTYDHARRFADFVYMVHVRYNLIYSGYQDDEVREDFTSLLNDYRKSGTDIATVLDEVEIRENSSKRFCLDVAERLAANDVADGGGLDQLIIARERRVKGNRRKIGNPAYHYSSNARIHYYKLTYRWDTVKLFIDELRRAATYG